MSAFYQPTFSLRVVAEPRERFLELLKAPMNEPAMNHAHSEGEVKSAQERSLRLMAADGWLTHAAHDKDARTRLTEGAKDIHDAKIRAYVQKRLTELSTQ